PAVGLPTTPPLHRTRPAQPGGRSQARSWFQPRKSLGFDLLPRDDVVRVSVVFSDAPLEFLALRLTQKGWMRLGGDGVPDFLDEGDALLAAKTINPQSLDCCRHCGPSTVSTTTSLYHNRELKVAPLLVSQP